MRVLKKGLYRPFQVQPPKADPTKSGVYTQSKAFGKSPFFPQLFLCPRLRFGIPHRLTGVAPYRDARALECNAALDADLRNRAGIRNRRRSTRKNIEVPTIERERHFSVRFPALLVHPGSPGRHSARCNHGRPPAWTAALPDGPVAVLPAAARSRCHGEFPDSRSLP